MAKMMPPAAMKNPMSVAMSIKPGSCPREEGRL